MMGLLRARHRCPKWPSPSLQGTPPSLPFPPLVGAGLPCPIARGWPGAGKSGMKSAFSFGLVCLLTPTGCRGLKIRGKTIKLMFKQTTILMKSTLTTIGRLLYAIPFAIFGLFHFMNAEAMAPMVPVPGGVFWVYLVGVASIAAAASIAMRKKAAWLPCCWGHCCWCLCSPSICPRYWVATKCRWGSF